jgi:hypothetical protein
MGTATIKEFASIEFQGIPRNERMHDVDALIDQIRPIAILAVELLSLDEGRTSRQGGGRAGCLEFLFNGARGDQAKASKVFKNIISAAEVRMAVALANVAGVATT